MSKTPRGGRKSRFTDADRAEMRRLYESGLSTRQIADQCGAHRASIHRMLRGVGVSMRPSGGVTLRKLAPEQEARVAHLAQTGLAGADLAEMFGIAPASVRDIVRRHPEAAVTVAPDGEGPAVLSVMAGIRAERNALIARAATAGLTRRQIAGSVGVSLVVVNSVLDHSEQGGDPS